MRKIAIILVSVLLVQILSPLGESVRIEQKYTYSAGEIPQTLHFDDVLEPTASLSVASKPISVWKRANGVAIFPTAKNMFTLKIPRTFPLDDIRITGHLRTKNIAINIDTDGNDLSDRFYYTEPVFVDPTDVFTYTIDIKSHSLLPSVSVIGLDTEESRMRITIGELTQAQGATDIVKRADWGADESLRYTDSATWKPIYAKMEAEKDIPKSAATLKYEEKVRNISMYLKTNFPEQNTTVDMVTEENGHPLVWPIEKTKKVERIIIHHTAENNVSNKDDLTLIRGIYYYHSVVRGWGDIGYNYIIGQRGRIYEGRAGGDYVVGAHTVWNNKSTVGVSIMGNFMQNSVVAEQQNALANIVTHLAQKYGIDIHKTSIGHKECTTNDCLIKDFAVANLSGHRDAGSTSCPGTNLYSLVESTRLTDTVTKGLAYRENTHINIQSVKVASATNTPSPTQTLSKGPNIRIRLSYTGSTIRLKSGDATLPRLSLGAKISGTLRKNLTLPFEAYGSDKVALVIGGKKYPFEKIELSAKLVQIPTWDRRPAWDTSGRYNDNIFRGKITVINEGGKLVVINELPLEDYLRGLAEVSNGDNEEKIKTILTAARSYAFFYINPSHRKFPGKPYDGSDNPDEFQKYLGYGYEQRSPLAGQLVDMTNGQLVTYKGDPIKVWYFNESNGRTLSYKEYCENRVANGTLSKGTVCEDIPYFQSVSDPGGVGHTQKGHGVGISGIGATYLAQELGFKYTQIIEYYLEGVKVEKKY